jgi:hypothetical protein
MKLEIQKRIVTRNSRILGSDEVIHWLRIAQLGSECTPPRKV